METKLPLISYVVKTQFITNNSGSGEYITSIYKSRHLFVREKAFEY